MSMEESVQHVVMMAIQEVCSTVFFFCFLFCCINLLTPRPRYAEKIFFILTLPSVDKIAQYYIVLFFHFS